MQSLAQKIQEKQKKSAIVDVRSGDTVRVHQKIVEGGKERVQIFEGLVIRVSRRKSLTQSFAVRRIASGIGVEKTYLIHSPNVLKVEVVRRSKVRRNYLSYMRNLTGKSARLSSVDFDRQAVNAVHDEAAEAEEAKLHDQKESAHEAAQAEKAEENAAADAKAEEAMESRKSEADKIEEQPILKPSNKNPEQEQNKA
jgi:large subunit ribosomal protein L19